MANTICILADAKLAVKKNNYITWGYMAYQFGLMVSSLLGPATVILVVQGSMEYVFKWNASLCLFLSMTPVIIFIILCYTTKADTQITVAAVLSSIFALIMMAVLVGIIGNLATHSVLDPNNIFMIALVGLYAFTGILHPQEIMCLVHGLLYYLCIPTAFVFLTVYSLTNLNNVSWGTRETKKANEDERPENKQKKEKKNKETVKSFLGASLTFDPQLSSDCYCRCGLGNFCQCNLCCRTIPKPMMVDGNHKVTEKTQNVIEKAPSISSISSQQTTEKNNVNPKADEMLGEDKRDLYEVLRGIFKDAKKKQLEGEEREFWDYMIQHYLHPLEENQEEKERIKSDLKALRNRMTVAYFLLNGLWVFFNFAVQLTITDISFHFTINGTLIKVNPVSFFFLLFFLLILIIQFGCMLVHRWSTTLHLLAVTSLRWNDGRDDIKKVKNNDEVLVGEAIAEEGNGDNRVLEASGREMNHSIGYDNLAFTTDSDSMKTKTNLHVDTTRNELKSKTEKKKEEILSKSGSNVVVVDVHTHEAPCKIDF